MCILAMVSILWTPSLYNSVTTYLLPSLQNALKSKESLFCKIYYSRSCKCKQYSYVDHNINVVVTISSLSIYSGYEKNTVLILIYIIIIKLSDYKVYVNQTHTFPVAGNYMVLNISQVIIM